MYVCVFVCACMQACVCVCVCVCVNVNSLITLINLSYRTVKAQISQFWDQSIEALSESCAVQMLIADGLIKVPVGGWWSEEE